MALRTSALSLAGYTFLLGNLVAMSTSWFVDGGMASHDGGHIVPRRASVYQSLRSGGGLPTYNTDCMALLDELGPCQESWH